VMRLQRQLPRRAVGASDCLLAMILSNEVLFDD